MNLDEIFLKSYLDDFNEREKKKTAHTNEDREIAKQKRRKIKIIEDFLQKFVNLEIHVTHKDQYSKNVLDVLPANSVPFEFYLVDSSKAWSPGVSILFDHPCEVEIAIPNKDKDGAVVIKVASHHPYSYILEQKFTNFEAACEALARFLSKCTVKIGKPAMAETAIKKISKNELLNDIPDKAPSKSKDVIKQNVSLDKINDLFYSKNQEE